MTSRKEFISEMHQQIWIPHSANSTHRTWRVKDTSAGISVNNDAAAANLISRSLELVYWNKESYAYLGKWHLNMNFLCADDSF